MSALACSSSAGLSWTRKVWPQWIGSHEVSGSWLRDRSSRHMRKCRESWECLDWRRERSGGIFLLDIWDNMKKAEPLLRYQQDERQWAHTQAQEILSEIRKHFFIVRLANTGTGSPERVWILQKNLCGDIQKSWGHGVGWSVLADPALKRVVGSRLKDL